MPFKLSINNPWALSLSFHGAVAALLGLGFLIFSRPPSASTLIEFTTAPVKESVPNAPYAVRLRVEAKPVPKARAVYGLNRKALTGPASDVSVKPGNTVAKEQDNEKLRADDPDSLPNPVEEFLVSRMPSLVSEVRIPYPPDAKQAGLQGPVVMDILIDQAGKVRDAKLLSGPGPSLNEAALAAVKNFQFNPAQVEGKAVAVRIRYAYRFVLEN